MVVCDTRCIYSTQATGAHPTGSWGCSGVEQWRWPLTQPEHHGLQLAKYVPPHGGYDWHNDIIASQASNGRSRNATSQGRVIGINMNMGDRVDQV